ncbi:MAG: hypothetical protein IT371_21155 [Deltaproteobacteria bacterium]|nr:hypothetical protein [Deltaproteobacteria bacterium]
MTIPTCTRRQWLSGASAAALLGLTRPLARAAGRPPFPELEAAGSPGTLGLAHGRAFGAAIGRSVAFYLRWLSTTAQTTPAEVLRRAEGFGPLLAQRHPELLEEMDGIAKGAGRTRTEILMVNARTDLAVLARRKAPKAQSGEALPGRERSVWPGCTALALVEGKGASARLALGQNWDWRGDVKENLVLLRLRPAGRPALVTFTEAGMVAKIGFNQHRLGVCLNFLSHRTDEPGGPFGVPVHCLLRLALSCRTLEEAQTLVTRAPRSASANLLLAQAAATGPVAADLELTPRSHARLPLREGVLVHANHYKDAPLAAGCTEQRNRSTLNRDQVATQLARELRAQLPDPTARLQQVLRSRGGAPYAVSKTPAPDSPSVTLAGIVMDLSRNELHLAAGAPHERPFVKVRGV